MMCALLILSANNLPGVRANCEATYNHGDSLLASTGSHLNVSPIHEDICESMCDFHVGSCAC